MTEIPINSVSIMKQNPEYLDFDARMKYITIKGTTHHGYFFDIAKAERLGLVKNTRGYTIVAIHDVHRN